MQGRIAVTLREVTAGTDRTIVQEGVPAVDARRLVDFLRNNALRPEDTSEHAG